MPEITVRWLDAEGVLQTGGLSEIADVDGRWFWVDVRRPDAATLETLQQRFDLHPLAVEDVLHTQHRPKLDVYDGGLFLVWLTPERVEGDGIIATELDVFLGQGYLITSHDDGSPVIETVTEGIERELGRGPDWLLHAIIDRLVDSAMPLVDALGDELDDIEDEMLGEPRKGELAALYATRRQLVQMHRIVAPERDVLRGLARERDLVSEEAYRYFMDVGDHLARVEDSIETYRDVGAGVMDIYLSAQSNRLNEIMKQLTVVAAIFMPLTLISGIYGMNVVKGMWPPVLAGWSFAAVNASMLAIALGMSIYFRRKNWW